MEPEKQLLLGNGCVNKEQFQNHHKATSQLATMEELLDVVFSIQSGLRLYRKAVWISPESL
jgi:hypothetical protein